MARSRASGGTWDRYVEAIAYLVSSVIGWLLQRFRRRLDHLPARDPSQLSVPHRLGHLALGFAVCLLFLVPLAWLIWK
jgi:hypothetical protein